MQVSEESSKPHLMEYCWNFLSNFSPDNKLGSLLIGCYKRRLFSPVKNLDSPDTLQSMFTQILRLVECMILLNDIYTLYDFRDFSRFEWVRFIIKRIRNILSCRNSIEEVLGLRIPKLVQIIHLTYCKKPRLMGAKGDTYRIDDLNIRSLTSIGKLSIIWTDILEDHLKLNLLDMTIFIKNDYLAPDHDSPMAYWHNL
jgi:hypothetical protein